MINRNWAKDEDRWIYTNRDKDAEWYKIMNKHEILYAYFSATKASKIIVLE